MTACFVSRRGTQWWGPNDALLLALTRCCRGCLARVPPLAPSHLATAFDDRLRLLGAQVSQLPEVLERLRIVIVHVDEHSHDGTLQFIGGDIPCDLSLDLCLLCR